MCLHYKQLKSLGLQLLKYSDSDLDPDSDSADPNFKMKIRIPIR